MTMMVENGGKQVQAEHEVKYVFRNTFAPVFINWLQLRCLADPLFPAARISSIYYDTRSWQLLSEKLSSDFYKSKFRVRWYRSLKENQPILPDRSFVEIKYKIGATREKVRFPSPYTGQQLATMNLTDPVLLELQDQARMQGAGLPATLYPAFQISYKRFRFLESKSGCRVSIDYDIHAPRVNGQMLTSIKPMSFLDTGVIEVKGPMTDLPDTLQQLTAFGCSKQAFSKYSSCYSLLTGIFF